MKSNYQTKSNRKLSGPFWFWLKNQRKSKNIDLIHSFYFLNSMDQANKLVFDGFFSYPWILFEIIRNDNNVFHILYYGVYFLGLWILESETTFDQRNSSFSLSI